MEVKEATQSWTKLADFFIDRVSGDNKDRLSAADYDEINSAADKFIPNVGIDEILPKSKKLMNINILSRKSDFREAEKMPSIWRALYSVSMDVVAVEMGHTVMAR